MARARNIKPGFFANEDLAECTPWARLCFIGLWLLADREGRLEDRPKRIKGELFRFDTVDVEPLLIELQGQGFIERYEVDGSPFIQISQFKRHQTPHYSEKPSTIKPPGLQEKERHIDTKDSGSTPRKPPASRGVRNPLNPDSLNPDSPNYTVPSGLVAEAATPAANGHDLAGPTPGERMPACPSEAIVDLYHRRLPVLPRVNVLTEAHRKTLGVRWREVCVDHADFEDVRAAGLEWFDWLFGRVATAPHLVGKSRGNWRASFDWLIKAENFAKVVNGNYHQQEARA